MSFDSFLVTHGKQQEKPVLRPGLLSSVGLCFKIGLGRQIYGEQERQSKSFHFPSDQHGQCRCAQQEPGARHSRQVSHVGAGSQGLGPSLAAVPGHKQGAGWEVELLGREPAHVWDASVFKVRILAAKPPCRALFCCF